jgi:hypothetical protein
MRLPAIAAVALTLSAAENVRFHNASGPLTEATPMPASAVGDLFLRSSAPQLQIGPEDIEGTYLAVQYKTAHNGVAHLVYRQRFQGVEVHNAEFTVNIDRDGRVLNAGGTLYNRPTASLAAQPREGKLVWFGLNGALRPAWVRTEQGEGIDSFVTVVDDESGRELRRDNMTLYQAARGLVFERGTPRPNPTPGVPNSDPPWVERTLQPFTGDTKASPAGWTSGNTTAGNNAIVGLNPLAIFFLQGPLSPTAEGRNFSFPLQLGPGAPPPYLFADAAMANLFYWVNRSHDLFYEIGFDEASGNFQNDNFGRGGVGGDALLAYTHFGTAAPSAARLNNAFFSTTGRADGSQSMIAMYLGAQGGVYTDGSYDADVIVHEYAHGVSSRLARQVYTTFQGGSMGEAWSDFFALEFLTPEGAPLDGIYGAAEYLFNSFGTGLRTRPVSTRLDVNPLTYRDLGRVLFFPQVHADGEIWVQALWDMRANLIRQHGEREGRRRTRLLVIDGMKLSPPASSMIDMRDAILLADRVGFDGASQAQIWEAFAKRGMGVLAASTSGSSTWISASFETPSRKGQLRFYGDDAVQGETIRLILHDLNQSAPRVSVDIASTSGDREVAVLDRKGDVYTGSIFASAFASQERDGVISLAVGDAITATYADPDTGSGPQAIEHTRTISLPYTLVTSPPAAPPTANEQSLGLVGGAGNSRRISLPFQFPYFGNKYGSAWVFPDGLIAFNTPSPGFCRDSSELGKIAAIAPMWGSFTTAGSAQPREGVYASTTADSVTIRWAAETEVLFGAQPRSPVNFSATLFADGRIEFRYGAGNKNLAAGRTFSTCQTASVTGISPGRDNFTHLSLGHLGFSDLENAATVTYMPPDGAVSAPEGRIDEPAAGATVRGLLQLSGLVWDRSTFVLRGDVLIDGRLAGRVGQSFLPRPQFCATNNLVNCATMSATLDLAGLGAAPGRHTVQIRALNGRGGVTNIPEEPLAFTLVEGQQSPSIGWIDAPADGGTARGTVVVRGWAGNPTTRVTAVDVLVDGLTVGRAAANQIRNDVCDAIRPAPLGCPLVGFTLNWNTASTNLPFDDGPHQLQIRALDTAGRYTLIPEVPFTVNLDNGPNQLPVSVLVTPANNETLSGVVRIWGYGWDPDGTVLGATLVVDGEGRATVPYGEPRPGECAALPDVRACPNIGFALEFDTRQLTNGPHVLGVVLFDDKLASSYSGGPNRRGINVVVDNR